MYYLESLIGAYHDSQLIITNTLCLSNINTILFALFWISNKIYSQNFYSNHVFLKSGLKTFVHLPKQNAKISFMNDF
jgi:hypothetical protein